MITLVEAKCYANTIHPREPDPPADDEHQSERGSPDLTYIRKESYAEDRLKRDGHPAKDG